MKNVRISEKGDIRLVIALIILFICALGLMSLLFIRGDYLATVHNLLDEVPYGALIQQGVDMVPEEDLKTHPNEILVLWKNVDGSCIPESCRFVWIGATEDELKAKNCGDKVVGALIGQQLYKPKIGSAQLGAKMYISFIGLMAMTDGGCPVGKPILSGDFTVDGRPAPIPEGSISWWQNVGCKVRKYLGQAESCTEFGYDPYGNTVWQGPLAWQTDQLVYVCKRSGMGTWCYPWNDPALTESDSDFVKNVNPDMFSMLNIFQKLSTPNK